MKIEELVAKYIELRDRKAKIKAEYDEKVDKIDSVLKKIEVALLKTFDEMGVESTRTDAGTAYKSTRSSCTVADKDMFMAYVQAEHAWELMDIRANKTAVSQYRGVHDDIPPGLSWREEIVVNVKR